MKMRLLSIWGMLLATTSSHAFVPPIDFLIEEWARTRQLKAPLHAVYDGHLIEEGKATPLLFKQEIFMLPDGKIRVDIKVGETQLSFLRGINQTALLKGKALLAKDPEAATQSLRFFQLFYPRTRKELIEQLSLKNILSKDEAAFLISPPANEGVAEAALSHKMKQKVTSRMYGNGHVAYALAFERDYFFLIDKAQLVPVGMIPKKEMEKFSEGFFEIQSLKLVENPLLGPKEPTPVPQKISFHIKNSLIHLQLVSENIKAPLNPKLIDINTVLKTTTQQDLTHTELTEQLVKYLYTFH